MNARGNICAAVVGLGLLLPTLAVADAMHGNGMMSTAVGHVVLDQNEWRSGDGTSTYRWDGKAWFGSATDRLGLRSEGKLDTDSGAVDEAQIEGLLRHAITPFFNVLGGMRFDIQPGRWRRWTMVGVEGLAPLFWDVGLFAFISDGGHTGARLEGHYDLLITQRLILQPQFEVNVYSKSDRRSGFGAGLSDLDAGLRLRYEFTRAFAPYIGLVYEKRYGQTATFARAAGERDEHFVFTAGLRLVY